MESYLLLLYLLCLNLDQIKTGLNSHINCRFEYFHNKKNKNKKINKTKQSKTSNNLYFVTWNQNIYIQVVKIVVTQVENCMTEKSFCPKKRFFVKVGCFKNKNNHVF